MTQPDAPEAFDFNRSLGASADDMGVTIWNSVFPRIAEAEAKLEGPYVAVVDERSSLRLDDRYLGRWRGGGFHVGAMGAALDSLMTAQTVLEHNVLPMVGMYPLVRAAMENAALAIYLLAPPERDERLRHSYLVADDDAQLRCTFSKSMGNQDAKVARTRTRVEILRLIAMRSTLGDPRAFRFSRVSYSDLMTYADNVIAADAAAPRGGTVSRLSWWQLLSGMSHGKQWAMIEALERSDAVVDPENEMAHVRMTSSAGAVALGLIRAMEMLEAALRLFERRSKVTWAEPEDAYEPPTVTFVQLRGQGGG